MENERKFLLRSNPQFALPVLAVLQMTETLVLVNKIQNQPGLEISSALYTTVLGFHPKRRSFSITNLPAQPEQQIDRTRDRSARLLSISAMAYNYMWSWSRLFGACSLAVHALLYSGQCVNGLALACGGFGESGLVLFRWILVNIVSVCGLILFRCMWVNFAYIDVG